MALRRELLPILLAAAFLLIGPGQALAAPTWLDAEPQQATAPANQAPDVATDADGNSVAVWFERSAVVAAYRPRGGDWGAPEDLDLGASISAGPLVTARTNGDFVAAWITDGTTLRSATRSTGGEWTAETVRGACCEEVLALEGTADGSVTLVVREDGVPSSNTRSPGTDAWGSRQPLPTSGYDRFAFAPDGSTVGIRLAVAVCAFDCLQASYRSPGAEGGWGAEELIPGSSSLVDITGYSVEATPDSEYTAVWGEADPGSGTPIPPSRVRSSDRPAGALARGISPSLWQTPLSVAEAPNDLVGSGLDVASGPDGAQVAVWQQGDRMTAAARGGAGAAWGSAEDVDAVGSLEARPFATITTSGVPAVAWGSAGAGTAFAHAAFRDAAGAWSARTLGPGAEGVVLLNDIDADGDGGALTGFRAPDGVFTAGFDGSGPRFSAFSLPSGLIAQPLPFSAAADDNWSGPPSISWLFGDGSGASGATVSHAYGSPGTFTAGATATDAVGNASQQSGPVTVTPPPTDPCGTADTDKDGIKDGCDDNNGAEKPVPFKTVNATVVSGEVFVKLPAGAASTSQTKPPKGFVRLEGAETIPVGSTLDTKRGRVKIRSAADTRRKTQTGQFYRGRFVIRQARIKRRSRKLITDMRLTGSSFRNCGSTRASVSQRRKRSKRKVRRLFGDAKGSFRTSGRNAAATVRGTRWGVQDRCDGTLVVVQRGRVEVRDKVKRKTIILRRGKTYLARAR